ncbi:purine-nucleoside phosphorylase [Hydrogenimonas thermophila]|uniref:5'-methylthioadenosine/S-adenosylhomocysteine nucleosidase family protein n=1 Tax=Hydrogenimonas thermophila TaxID=223786 RepID=UPI0029372377|nr:purine-nucleoside phosphorylase [Hydrogenimonas thermophila]WOE69958.1 purine-nucleoside phosphorylase [Hydrogenimonas thermophila]WOE72475.1 purine-nucleoside phosphorylase [Hydrogenimonas thermophila]
MIICAGNNETFPFATPIGMGLCESAVNLTRLVLMNPPEFLLFVGSAGSYGKFNIFDIVESKAASQIELSFLLKKSYTPLENNVIVSDENVSRETPLAKIANEGRPIIVNSSNYISTDFHLAQNFNRLGIGLENMEFYSVMQVAQNFNIPCGGIFVITNMCNENAHNDFLANHNEAMTKLIEYLKKRIPNLETFHS